MVITKIKTVLSSLAIMAIVALLSGVIALHLLHIFGGKAFAFFSSTTQTESLDKPKDSLYKPHQSETILAANMPDPNSGCGCPGCCMVSKL